MTVTLTKGKYYNRMLNKHNYQQKLQDCIEDACKICLNAANATVQSNVQGNHPLMMLGKIQSGKTRAFTGLMALAFDNGFDMVLILTKNSQPLVKQTYKRMRQEFAEAIAENETDIFDIMKTIDELTAYELNKKIVLIAKKEKRNLDRIIAFISDYSIQQHKNCIIIDDEADTTGIGYARVKNTEDLFDLRTVASKVNEIRGDLKGCAFVQVTATPYALYLQPDFNETKVEPVRPKNTVLVPSGEGYVGGEYYFIKSKDDSHPARHIFEPVSEDENALVSDQKRKGRKSKINDRRSFKEEFILSDKKSLEVFKKGIINFIVGGCVLNMADQKITHYSYVIHTATSKASHIKLDSITQLFIEQIKTGDKSTVHIIEEMLKDAYDDIQRSITAYERIMPDYSDVKTAFYNAINKGFVSTTTVNSDKDMDTVLDEDTGELKLRTPYSIFVGGQVLDRGVTIPNMIGFYYGRNPRRMQQDTVMQHSRMFGYRDENLLSVTRFYTTRRIYENLTKITEFDTALREDIENGTFENGLIFIQKHLSQSDEIVPCAPTKIALSEIVLLKPGSRVLPVGFAPVAKSYASRISNNIKNSLSKLISEGTKDSVLVPVDKVKPIIELVYSAINKDENSGRFVEHDMFLSSMQYLTQDDNRIHLIVRRNRKVSKYKSNGTTLQDSPDTAQDELKLASQVAINNPALMLIHQDGTAKGWGGSEFWWPVLYVHKNANRAVYAMPDPAGKIKDDEDDDEDDN